VGNILVACFFIDSQCISLGSYSGLKLQVIKDFDVILKGFTISQMVNPCVQFSWNLADGKSVKSCVIYLTKQTKFRLAVSLSLLDGSRPKSARTSGRQCVQEYPKFHPNQFTSGGVIAERVNTVETRDKANPIFGCSYSFLPSNNLMMNNI